MNLNEPELNIECNNKEADKIEALLLNTLDEHARLSNPVTVIVGLINTLLTVVTRLNVHKGSFFELLNQGWELFSERAKEEQTAESQGKIH